MHSFLSRVSLNRPATHNPLSYLLGRVCLAVSLLITSPWASSVQADGASELVLRTTNAVLHGLGADESLANDKERLYAFVQEKVATHFDFKTMSKRVLGKYWRKASPEEKASFVEGFRRLLVRTYATAMANYRGQSISVAPSTQRGKLRVVKMTVTQRGAPPIPITYSMNEQAGTWKVQDVAIDGASLVITYRGSFAAEIRKNGIDGLIRRLHAHNKART